jgi:RNA polymerase sigma factor (sigma-70 family)
VEVGRFRVINKTLVSSTAQNENNTFTDQQLLENLRRGEESAFDTLFVRYYPQVYRVLYRLVVSHEEAEDLTQETFLALYDQPPKLKPEVSLGVWLYRVALNRGYNRLRSVKREHQRLERLNLPGTTEADPQNEILRAEERANVRAALARLAERQNKLLVLRYAGLSHAEIANVLEIAVGSVGSLLDRAERAFLLAYEKEKTGPEVSKPDKGQKSRPQDEMRAK